MSAILACAAAPACRRLHHGLYGEYGNACVDARVISYLSTGRLTCRKAP